MTQQEKDLLIKDLCSRLPYGVKIETLDGPQIFDIKWLSINMCNIASPYLPYLFPLSSMTEEQEIEFKGLLSEVYDFSFRMEELLEFIQSQENIPFHFMDWLVKNNFDYRGLIPLGLAIDATDLNVY